MKPKSCHFSRHAWTALALSFTAAAMVGSSADAAQRTWTGNSSTDLNSLNGFDVVPVSGVDQLIFGAAGTAGTTLTNTFPGLVLLNAGTPAILFNAGASAYTFTGNTITLGTGVTAQSIITNNSGVLQTFSVTDGVGVNVSSSFVLQLNAGTGGLNFTTGIVNKTNNFTISAVGTGLVTISNLNMAAASSGVTINGAASNIVLGGITATANGGFTWAGTGTLTLGGASTHNGNTTFNTGTVVLNGSLTGGGTVFAAGSTITQSATGSIAGARTLTVGAGSMTLSGANTYTGATNLNSGSLVLDFSAATTPATATNILNNTANSSVLNLANGSLILRGGGAAASNSQRFNNVNFLTNSSSKIIVDQNGATAVDVTLGTIARGVGGTTDVTLPTGGSITTTSTGFASNGVLTSGTSNGLAFATANGGTTWATNTAGTLGGLSTYATGNANYIAASNVDVTNGDSVSGVTVNTLRINGASTTLTLAGTNVVSTGGILVTPTGTGAVITGGTLSGNATNRELIFHNYGTLALDTTLVNNGGATAATFAGTGTTTVSGTNTYTGPTAISSGTVRTTSAQALGLNSLVNFSTHLTANLELGGNLTVGALAGGGVPTGAVGGSASGGNINLGANTLTFGGAGGTPTYNGSITGAGVIAMDGAGTQILGGTSNFSGGSFIRSGTLTLNSATAAGTGKITLGNTTGSSAATLGRSGSNTVSNAVEVVGTGTRTLLSSGGTNLMSGTLKLDTNLVVQNTSNNAFTLSGAISNLTTGGNLSFTSNGNAASNTTVSGAMNFTGSITNSTAGSATTLSGIIGANVTTVTANTGTLNLNAANLYASGTFINSTATLATGAAGDLGLGDVTIIGGGRLTLGNAVSFGANSVLFYDSTSGSVVTLGTGIDSLAGVVDTVDGQILAAGTYTAAQLNTALGGTVFTGPGSLAVLGVPEPGSLGLLGLGLATLTFRRTRRRA